MEPCASRGVTQLLAHARQANGDGLGALLELYRDYLGVLARARLGARLRGVVNPSDLVQQTFLEACRDFGQFAGTSTAQWRAWLRGILAHNLAAVAERHLRARKRDVRRQVPLEPRAAAAGDSTAGPGVALASPDSSPSAQAQHHEATAVLADQLARLPAPDREVLRLRNLEGLAFEEVARRMGRTPGAVRVLWVRALDRLRLLLKEEDLL
jgi:RNA polymerase sigma-70 factor (ECF subfamily)